MNDRDLCTLVEHLTATAELMGQEMKPNAIALMADDLSAYPIQALLRALKRVRSEHTGKLTPKSVMDRLDDVLGRLPANEAWAVAITAQDERATVVWTDEICDAWAISQPLAEARDMVGARMAFIAAYERITREARDAQKMPATQVSIGWDADLRNVALERAVQMGRIDSAQASDYATKALPAPGFNPVALLTGRVEATKEATPEMRARLAELRSRLAGGPTRAELDAGRVQAERVELEKLKQAAQAAVNAYAEKQETA